MKLTCKYCGKTCEHKTVSYDGTKGDTSYLSSCRGIAPDYRTVECSNCGKKATYDFATD